MKIGLVGLLYENNLGDPLLFDCTRHLINKSEPNINIVYIDFFARKVKTNMIAKKSKLTLKLICVKSANKLVRFIRKKPSILCEEVIWNSIDKNYIEDYLDDKLTGLEGIIIMGAGTLKYDKRLNFAPYYKAIMDVAENKNIPVFLNTVGVESSYNPQDRRCNMFEVALNNKMMKIITTRDDIDTLKKFINRQEIEVAKTADIGIWASETYDTVKNEKSDTIGLGVIAPIRFKEFGRDISESTYSNTLVDIIRDLEKQGVNWRIFNNGDDCDIEFAITLCMKLNFNIEDKILTPTTPKELVQIISNFSGIITSRLHSCIVAYSLDIPFIALSWNNKIQYFAKNLGVEERVINEHEFDYKIILERFNKACLSGYDQNFRKEYQDTNVTYIKKYLSEIQKYPNK